MSWLALFYCICTHTHVQIVCGVYENEKWHHIGAFTDRLGVRKFGFGLGSNRVQINQIEFRIIGFGKLIRIQSKLVIRSEYSLDRIGSNKKFIIDGLCVYGVPDWIRFDQSDHNLIG